MAPHHADHHGARDADLIEVLLLEFSDPDDPTPLRLETNDAELAAYLVEHGCQRAVGADRCPVVTGPAGSLIRLVAKYESDFRADAADLAEASEGEAGL